MDEPDGGGVDEERADGAAKPGVPLPRPPVGKDDLPVDPGDSDLADAWWAWCQVLRSRKA